MVIYKATNIVNGKSYIGQAKNLKTRKQTHILNAFDRLKDTYFYNALRKYGSENFTWEVIDECESKSELNHWETYYINYYRTYVGFPDRNGYNMTLGGDGGDTISNHPNRHDIFEYHRSRIGKLNPNFGMKHSDETRKKMSENHCRHSKGQHPRSKTYTIIDPAGTEFIIKGEFELFCKEHNISPRILRDNIGKGKIKYRHKDSIRNNGWEVVSVV
jgi:hypothetical protein